MQDAVKTITEEEKQGLVKGKALAQMLRKFDSLFDVIVDMYEGAAFYEQHADLNATGSMGQTLQNHMTSIDTAVSEFTAEEQIMRATYNGAVDELKTKFANAVQTLAQAVGGDTRVTSFFEKSTWVPAGEDYADLKNAVTPEATSTNDSVEKLGKAIVEAICGTEEGGYNDGLLADLGNGLEYQWMWLWRQMTRWGWIWTPMYCQLAVDQKFMRYSNTMAMIQMLLTNFTSTEGLNHETNSQESWKSWWQGGGKYHLDNYPYAHDEKLRNAEVGRRVVESMTKSAFVYGESQLELEAQKVLAELTGENVGSFYYRENPTEVIDLEDIGYSRSVIGEDRYHDMQNGEYQYKGTMAKKYKEIADKQFLMAGSYTEPPSASTSVPVESGAIAEYNDAVEAAISAFNAGIQKMISGVESAELVPTADSKAYTVEHWDGTGWVFTSQMNDFDLKKFDVYAMAEDDVEAFQTDMISATGALFRTLMDNVFAKGTVDAPQGLRGTVQPTTSYDTEGNLRALERDIWDLTNLQLEYYEDVIKLTRDAYEYGSPGTTWDDAMRGMAYGRRWVHLYGKDKFEEYYSPDPRKFTNDSTYNMVERTGTSYIKAINVLSQGQPVNMAWSNWKQYNNESNLAGGIANNAYMISSLQDGIKQMVGDKEKVFGDMELDYEIQDIIDYHSGAFVYYKVDGRAVTDQEQRNAITATYRRQTFDMNKIRPQRIVTTDDQGLTTETWIMENIKDKRKMDGTRKAQAEKGLLMGGIVEFNALTGAKITQVFAAGGNTTENLRNFANGLAGSILNFYGLSEVSAIALGIGIRLSRTGKWVEDKDKEGKGTGEFSWGWGVFGEAEIEMGLLSELALDRNNLLGVLSRVMEITGQELIFLGTVGGQRGTEDTASLQMLTFSREDYEDLQAAKEFAKMQVELRELRMEKAELELEGKMDLSMAEGMTEDERLRLSGLKTDRVEELKKIEASLKAKREEMKEFALQEGQVGMLAELREEAISDSGFVEMGGMALIGAEGATEEEVKAAVQKAEAETAASADAITRQQETIKPQFRTITAEDGSIQVVSVAFLEKKAEITELESKAEIQALSVMSKADLEKMLAETADTAEKDLISQAIKLTQLREEVAADKTQGVLLTIAAAELEGMTETEKAEEVVAQLKAKREAAIERAEEEEGVAIPEQVVTVDIGKLRVTADLETGKGEVISVEVTKGLRLEFAEKVELGTEAAGLLEGALFEIGEAMTAEALADITSGDREKALVAAEDLVGIFADQGLAVDLSVSLKITEELESGETVTDKAQLIVSSTAKGEMRFQLTEYRTDMAVLRGKEQALVTVATKEDLDKALDIIFEAAGNAESTNDVSGIMEDLLSVTKALGTSDIKLLEALKVEVSIEVKGAEGEEAVEVKGVVTFEETGRGEAVAEITSIAGVEISGLKLSTDTWAKGAVSTEGLSRLASNLGAIEKKEGETEIAFMKRFEAALIRERGAEGAVVVAVEKFRTAEAKAEAPETVSKPRAEIKEVKVGDRTVGFVGTITTKAGETLRVSIGAAEGKEVARAKLEKLAESLETRVSGGKVSDIAQVMKKFAAEGVSVEIETESGTLLRSQVVQMVARPMKPGEKTAPAKTFYIVAVGTRTADKKTMVMFKPVVVSSDKDVERIEGIVRDSGVSVSVPEGSAKEKKEAVAAVQALLTPGAGKTITLGQVSKTAEALKTVGGEAQVWVPLDTGERVLVSIDAKGETPVVRVTKVETATGDVFTVTKAGEEGVTIDTSDSENLSIVKAVGRAFATETSTYGEVTARLDQTETKRDMRGVLTAVTSFAQLFAREGLAISVSGGGLVFGGQPGEQESSRGSMLSSLGVTGMSAGGGASLMGKVELMGKAAGGGLAVGGMGGIAGAAAMVGALAGALAGGVPTAGGGAGGGGRTMGMREFVGRASAVAAIAGVGIRAEVEGGAILQSTVKDGKLMIMVMAQKLSSGQTLKIMPEMLMEVGLQEVKTKYGTVAGKSVAEQMKALAGFVTERAVAKFEQITEMGAKIKAIASAKGIEQLVSKLKQTGITGVAIFAKGKEADALRPGAPGMFTFEKVEAETGSAVKAKEEVGGYAGKLGVIRDADEVGKGAVSPVAGRKAEAPVEAAKAVEAKVAEARVERKEGTVKPAKYRLGQFLRLKAVGLYGSTADARNAAAAEAAKYGANIDQVRVMGSINGVRGQFSFDNRGDLASARLSVGSMSKADAFTQARVGAMKLGVKIEKVSVIGSINGVNGAFTFNTKGEINSVTLSGKFDHMAFASVAANSAAKALGIGTDKLRVQGNIQGFDGSVGFDSDGSISSISIQGGNFSSNDSLAAFVSGAADIFGMDPNGGNVYVNANLKGFDGTFSINATGELTGTFDAQYACSSVGGMMDQIAQFAAATGLKKTNVQVRGTLKGYKGTFGINNKNELTGSFEASGPFANKGQAAGAIQAFAAGTGIKATNVRVSGSINGVEGSFGMREDGKLTGSFRGGTVKDEAALKDIAAEKASATGIEINNVMVSCTIEGTNIKLNFSFNANGEPTVAFEKAKQIATSKQLDSLAAITNMNKGQLVMMLAGNNSMFKVEDGKVTLDEGELNAFVARAGTAAGSSSLQSLAEKSGMSMGQLVMGAASNADLMTADGGLDTTKLDAWVSDVTSMADTNEAKTFSAVTGMNRYQVAMVVVDNDKAMTEGKFDLAKAKAFIANATLVAVSGAAQNFSAKTGMDIGATALAIAGNDRAYVNGSFNMQAATTLLTNATNVADSAEATAFADRTGMTIGAVALAIVSNDKAYENGTFSMTAAAAVLTNATNVAASKETQDFSSATGMSLGAVALAIVSSPKAYVNGTFSMDAAKTVLVNATKVTGTSAAQDFSKATGMNLGAVALAIVGNDRAYVGTAFNMDSAVTLLTNAKSIAGTAAAKSFSESTGMNLGAAALAAVNNTKSYIGGAFSVTAAKALLTNATSIAKTTAAQDFSAATGMSLGAVALAAAGDDRSYIGGVFSIGAAQEFLNNATNVSKMDSAKNFSAATGMSIGAVALAVAGNAKSYVNGTFSIAAAATFLNNATSFAGTDEAKNFSAKTGMDIGAVALAVVGNDRSYDGTGKFSMDKAKSFMVNAANIVETDLAKNFSARTGMSIGAAALAVAGDKRSYDDTGKFSMAKAQELLTNAFNVAGTFEAEGFSKLTGMNLGAVALAVAGNDKAHFAGKFDLGMARALLTNASRIAGTDKAVEFSKFTGMNLGAVALGAASDNKSYAGGKFSLDQAVTFLDNSLSQAKTAKAINYSAKTGMSLGAVAMAIVGNDKAYVGSVFVPELADKVITNATSVINTPKAQEFSAKTGMSLGAVGLAMVNNKRAYTAEGNFSMEAVGKLLDNATSTAATDEAKAFSEATGMSLGAIAIAMVSEDKAYDSITGVFSLDQAKTLLSTATDLTKTAEAKAFAATTGMSIGAVALAMIGNERA